MSSLDARAQILERSVLVVAHPDDEVLWFSSIVRDVGRLVVCYADCDSLPTLTAGRHGVIDSYPIRSVTWLRRPEPCSYGTVDWKNPIASPYGMELNRTNDAERKRRYRRSFETIREDLAGQLRGAANVFTHNPWGEYGNPDHVLVSRAVESLRRELGFRPWYSNYVSPHSMAFAARSLLHVVEVVRLPTDPPFVAEIKALYERHKCWTWHADHVPFADEAFFDQSSGAPRGGTMTPLNCVTP